METAEVWRLPALSLGCLTPLSPHLGIELPTQVLLLYSRCGLCFLGWLQLREHARNLTVSKYSINVRYFYDPYHRPPYFYKVIVT